MLTAGCGAALRRPWNFTTRAEPASRPAIDVRIALQSEHRRDGDRVLRAAVATLNICSEWLGAFPRPSLTLVDAPWRSAAALPPDAVLMDRVPWWTTATSMTHELAVARAVSRRFWRERIDTASLPPWFVEALAEYVARRAVTALFSAENPGAGVCGSWRSAISAVSFRGSSESGCWRKLTAFSSRRSSNNPPSTSSTAGVVRGRKTPRRQDAADPRYPRAMGRASCVRSDRHGVHDRIVRTSDPRRVRAHRVGDQRTGSVVAVRRSPRDISRVRLRRRTADQRAGDSRHASRRSVVVRRIWRGAFHRPAAAPVGPFESGRGISVRVTFDDGQQRTELWDGRSRDKTSAIGAQREPHRPSSIPTASCWMCTRRTTAEA